MPGKVVAQHRRARYDYEIMETVEAGIQLTGGEVKSCRDGHVQMPGSYVSFLHDKPVLKGLKISRYKMAADDGHQEQRDRPLLLKQNEIDKLQRSSEEKGLTLIPLEIRAGKYIKVVIGLARGKKKFDKRQSIKDRDIRREMRGGRR